MFHVSPFCFDASCILRNSYHDAMPFFLKGFLLGIIIPTANTFFVVFLCSWFPVLSTIHIPSASGSVSYSGPGAYWNGFHQCPLLACMTHSSSGSGAYLRVFTNALLPLIHTYWLPAWSSPFSFRGWCPFLGLVCMFLLLSINLFLLLEVLCWLYSLRSTCFPD